MTNTIYPTAAEIAAQVALYMERTTKDVLTTDEAAAYLGLSKSYLYKLTSMNLIPYSKPLGKLCYFKKEDLKKWATANRQFTTAEIDQQAAEYFSKKGGAL